MQKEVEAKHTYIDELQKRLIQAQNQNQYLQHQMQGTL